MKTRHRRPSKIVPNNGPLAVAARGGHVLESMVGPPQQLPAFKPWERSQPAYVAWFRKTMAGEPCQCEGLGCAGLGQERHHESRGANKDDRTLVWLSSHCHHSVRHHKECTEDMITTCRAAAGENWLSYCNALEP